MYQLGTWCIKVTSLLQILKSSKIPQYLCGYKHTESFSEQIFIAEQLHTCLYITDKRMLSTLWQQFEESPFPF